MFVRATFSRISGGEFYHKGNCENRYGGPKILYMTLEQDCV